MKFNIVFSPCLDHMFSKTSGLLELKVQATTQNGPHLRRTSTAVWLYPNDGITVRVVDLGIQECIKSWRRYKNV